MKRTLLVIDMLKGFCQKGYPLSLPDSTKNIEAFISKRIEEVLSEDGSVAFLCDAHELSDPEINNPYPQHCMKGTVEAEIVDSLSHYVNDARVIKKNTLSSFYNTELDNYLNEVNPEVVELLGVCTDICILFASYELRIRGYQVDVNTDGVLPLSPNNQQFFLTYMKEKLGVDVN